MKPTSFITRRLRFATEILMLFFLGCATQTSHAQTAP